MIYLELFLTFLKIGAFTFGGGYAMLPLIQSETVARGWIGAEALMDFVAVAESTPGPFAINIATYIGAETGGILGAACATLGVVLPSFVIIFALSFVLRQFRGVEQVQWAFYGVRAAVLALIIRGWVSMAKACPKSVFSLIVAVASFVCAVLFDKLLGVSVIWVIAGAALCGLVYSVVREKTGKGARK